MPRFCSFALVVALSLLHGCPKEPGSPAPAAPPTTAQAPSPTTPPPPPPTQPTTTPGTLPPMPIPADNPQSPAKVALGHQLFFDPRLSVDGSRSCYSCHRNEDGNGGHEPIAVGAGNKVLTRHSPVIWNVGWLQALYWDGRAPSLEAQALAAWTGGNMGIGKEPEKQAAKAAEIAAIPGYKSQFDAVFPGEGVTPQTIMKAIAAYERTLVCDDTPWDRAQKGDANALSEEQKKGQELFLGKAGCAACHAPPFFSSAMGTPGAFYNVGIGTQGKDEKDVDVGRMSVTKADADWAAFKVPSLRNVSKSAPYFHDGSVATLEDAVKRMASGGIKNKNLSPLLTDKQLTADEVRAIVAFLHALDCNEALDEPKLP